MNTTNKYQIDMTHGPLFSKIVIFSLPLMSSYVMLVLFNTIDLVVIGRFASREAMAAVGATSGLTVLVLNIFFGLSVGVNVLAQLEETPETPPSSRDDGLLFLHLLESNPESSLQTPQEA